MSRESAEKQWNRLVSEFNLTREEQTQVHRHLANNYSLEKDYMSYEELKSAASEVVLRIR